MKVSIVIPQLFYDVIARVIPGFVFLFMLYLCDLKTFSQFLQVTSQSSVNIVDSLGRGVGLSLICYILGWVIHAVTVPSFEKSTMEKHKSGDDLVTLRKKYQWVRLTEVEAGFRILKLRAEARMLETLRMGLWILALFSLVMNLSKSACPGYIFMTYVTVIGVVCLLSSFAILLRLEKEAWDRYWGNVVIVYELLQGDGSLRENERAT